MLEPVAAIAGHHPAWLPPAAFARLRDFEITLQLAQCNTAGGWNELESAVLQTVQALAGEAQIELEIAEPFTSQSNNFLDVTDWRLNPEAFRISHNNQRIMLEAVNPRGLLYGFFELVRLGGEGLQTIASDPGFEQTFVPVTPYRMLDHWDNIKKHDVMGQVERGYSGGSIFYDDGDVREDLSAVARYAELLASVGINRVAINNVNVGPHETRLLGDLLPEVKRIADIFRLWGITTFVSVSWAAPKRLGGLETTDPFDSKVQKWWADTAKRVWELVPDFGGFVIKADSEGQPGPFAYGRTHADGANMLARAVAPFGGEIYWRAFVYNHTQDWRDRTTDRAKAAYEHFAPHDGTFEPNVIVQVKHGPLDFQVREATSPTIAAMPNTRLAAEFQVTTEYLGQQKHAVYLGRMWSELLNFHYFTTPNHKTDDHRTMADLVTNGTCNRGGGFAAVSNVGDDYFWTGHPFAQANLYAWGRLTWDPTLDPDQVLQEWINLTFPEVKPEARNAIFEILAESWETYETYTAPLGVGFMIYPHHHYGPSPDGYEYTPWGTYHFADRDGVGVDRTRATGSGFTAQYPTAWSEVYESLELTPDELLLFFHHVPYTHKLKSGKTVIQHIYDDHFEGLDKVLTSAQLWEEVKENFPADIAERVNHRMAEQIRSATDWRDIINTYFLRKSGIPDEYGRYIAA